MTVNQVRPVSRARPPECGSERDTLTGLLDFLRSTVVNKVAGLTDEQAFGRPVPPSALCPAGVVKHLTGVERFWFSIDFAGADLPWPWSEEDPHGNLLLAAGCTLASIVDAYVEECDRPRRAIQDVRPRAHREHPARARRHSGQPRVRPSVQRLLDAMTGAPAYVRTRRLDILGTNLCRSDTRLSG